MRPPRNIHVATAAPPRPRLRGITTRRPRRYWAGVAIYGVGNGPCVGFFYDILNRVTETSERGMSVVMLGLNAGASFVPFGTTLYFKPAVFVYVILASQAIPAAAGAFLWARTRPAGRWPPVGERIRVGSF